MTILQDVFTLINGTEIRKVGFGTWQIPSGDVCYNAVKNALKHGYRHIDTALAYGNEASVGQAIRDSGIPREEIYVTTKLPAEKKSYSETLTAFEESFSNLGLEYIDLYLIHAPWPWSERGANYDKENRAVWHGMEEIYETGKVRAIGVSNFNVHDLENVLGEANIRPMVNQIRYYAGFTQEETTLFCKENNILVEAYSPLATGRLLENPELLALAEKYQVSLPQLAIRFCIQNGVLPLPKATGEDHIATNAKLDFVISEADMEVLNKMEDTAK